jgi:hypothetical protein
VLPNKRSRTLGGSRPWEELLYSFKRRPPAGVRGQRERAASACRSALAFALPLRSGLRLRCAPAPARRVTGTPRSLPIARGGTARDGSTGWPNR